MNRGVGTICKNRLHRIVPKVPRKPKHVVLKHGTNFGDVMAGKVPFYRARWNAEGCGCNGLADLMDQLGVDEVEQQYGRFLEEIYQSAADYSEHIFPVPAPLRSRPIISLALRDCIRTAKRERQTNGNPTPTAQAATS